MWIGDRGWTYGVPGQLLVREHVGGRGVAAMVAAAVTADDPGQVARIDPQEHQAPAPRRRCRLRRLPLRHGGSIVCLYGTGLEARIFGNGIGCCDLPSWLVVVVLVVRKMKTDEAGLKGRKEY